MYARTVVPRIAYALVLSSVLSSLLPLPVAADDDDKEGTVIVEDGKAGKDAKKLVVTVVIEVPNRVLPVERKFEIKVFPGNKTGDLLGQIKDMINGDPDLEAPNDPTDDDTGPKKTKNLRIQVQAASGAKIKQIKVDLDQTGLDGGSTKGAVTPNRIGFELLEDSLVPVVPGFTTFDVDIYSATSVLSNLSLDFDNSVATADILGGLADALVQDGVDAAVEDATLGFTVSPGVHAIFGARFSDPDNGDLRYLQTVSASSIAEPPTLALAGLALLLLALFASRMRAAARARRL